MLKSWTATLAVFFVASVTFAGGGIAFTQDVQGSLASTANDIDEDGGTTASVGQLAGSSTLGGDLTAQTLTELATLPGANTDCLPSEVQFPFVYASAVERLTGPGVLIYFAMDPVAGGYACADPVTGAINGSLSLVIIGGTGPAASATGTATFDFSGVPVGTDHTALTGVVSGVIVP